MKRKSEALLNKMNKSSMIALKTTLDKNSRLTDIQSKSFVEPRFSRHLTLNPTHIDSEDKDLNTIETVISETSSGTDVGAIKPATFKYLQRVEF